MASRARSVVQMAESAEQALRAVESDLRNVESCMREIEGIVRKARLVSLNGRIEATAAGEFGEGFAVVAAETGELALRVTRASAQIREVVQRLTETIQSTSEGDLLEARSSCDELASAIARSVMGLQFQDAVSQRMRHVSSTLGEIRRHITDCLSDPNSDAAARKSAEWLERMSSSYCVDEERAVHTGDMGVPETSGPGDVELF